MPFLNPQAHQQVRRRTKKAFSMKSTSTLLALIVLSGAVAALPTASGIVPLILGGKAVPSGSKTYVVGLKRETATESNYCGGLLIVPKHVLTAVHCHLNKIAQYVSIGTYYSSGTQDGEQIAVVEAFEHPNYFQIQRRATRGTS